LSSAGNQYAMVIIGVLLVVVMMFFPRGIIVTLARDLPRYGWRATMAAAWAGR
jgi:ABC-type branched-subunit amino acid transport system permease subunit